MLKTLVVLSMIQGNLNLVPDRYDLERQYVGWACETSETFMLIYHYPYQYPFYEIQKI